MVGLVSSAWSKCSHQEPLAARILWLSQGHRKIGSFHAVQGIDHLDATFIPSSVLVVQVQVAVCPDGKTSSNHHLGVGVTVPRTG